MVWGDALSEEGIECNLCLARPAIAAVGVAESVAASMLAVAAAVAVTVAVSPAPGVAGFRV